MTVGIVDLLAGQLTPLLAYIGPGADLALISSAIGLIATMGASLTFMVLYPFRLLWRRLKAGARGQGTGVRGQESASPSPASRGV